MGSDGEIYLPTPDEDERHGTLFARDARLIGYLVDVEAQARALQARHGSHVRFLDARLEELQTEGGALAFLARVGVPPLDAAALARLRGVVGTHRNAVLPLDRARNLSATEAATLRAAAAGTGAMPVRWRDARRQLRRYLRAAAEAGIVLPNLPHMAFAGADTSHAEKAQQDDDEITEAPVVFAKQVEFDRGTLGEFVVRRGEHVFRAALRFLSAKRVAKARNKLEANFHDFEHAVRVVGAGIVRAAIAAAALAPTENGTTGVTTSSSWAKYLASNGAVGDVDGRACRLVCLPRDFEMFGAWIKVYQQLVDELGCGCAQDARDHADYTMTPGAMLLEPVGGDG